MNRGYRVMVVDDHSLFAEALVIALRGTGIAAECVVPREEMSVARLVREVRQEHPDLVLLDLNLGCGVEGTSLVSSLTGVGVAVALVTGSEDRARHGEALAAGAVAVIHKSMPFATIVEIVSRIRAGLPVMSRETRAELVTLHRAVTASQQEIRKRFEQITRREAEVLGLLMSGKQVSDIARARVVSESTVRTQVKSILAKLQVSSQLSAVGLAHEVEWQPPPQGRGSRSSTDRSSTGLSGRSTRPKANRARWTVAS
jgi:two-component system, NarL family, nitrate/nitrite response regulator NarL